MNHDRFEAGPDHYAQLARYYQSHGDQIKGNILTVVPWLLAIAGTLLGLAISQGGLLACWEPVFARLMRDTTAVCSGTTYRPGLATVLSILALAVSWVAMRVGHDMRDHLDGNWRTAKHARRRLKEIMSSLESHPEIELWGYHRSQPDAKPNERNAHSRNNSNMSVLDLMKFMPKACAWTCAAIVVLDLALVGFASC